MGVDVEQSQVQFGKSAIPYVIHRSQRQKTVAVRVDPVEGVSVRAPRATPVERLDQIVHGKSRWILDRRRRVEDLPPAPSPREFVSGETFLYLGRQYRLKLVRGRAARERGARLGAGRILVPAAPPNGAAAAVRDHLGDWYRRRAEIRLPPRVAFWSERLGLHPTAILISDQKRRWGSVNKTQGLRLKWRVVQTSVRVVDYVIVHELTHLVHRHHDRNFWAALGAAIGDYESRREDLRRIGPGIVW